jgi:carboxyl-terminal processing protease
MKTSEISTTTNALLAGNAIFNFATEYYYSHKLESPEIFEFTDEDFIDFKNFLDKTDFNYQTLTEIELNEAMATAKLEGFEGTIIQNYKTILNEIEVAKKEAVDEKKSEISSLLADEIVKRYFYREGLYQHYVLYNPDILKAKEILNNKQRYAEILK